MPRYSSVLLPSDFPAKILYVFLISPIRAKWLTHLILLDLGALMMPVPGHIIQITEPKQRAQLRATQDKTQ